MKMVKRVDTGAAATDTVSVTPVVVGWVVAGLVCVAGLIVVLGPPGPVGATFFMVLALAVVAETVVVQMSAGRSAMSLSLLEGVVVIGLLTLPAVDAVSAILSGIAIIQLVRRIDLQKVAFNVGQHAVAATAAASIMSMAPAEPIVSSPRLAAAVVAVLAYSGINSIALAGVFVRLGLASFREQLTERPGFLVATSVGNASVGALVVTLWHFAPSVVWIMFGPILALYLSYGSSFRIESLLSDVSTERDHLDRVVSGVQEGIVLLDADGDVRLWNPAMTRLIGVSAADALGRSARALLTGVDSDGMEVSPTGLLHGRVDTAAYVATLTDVHGGTVVARFMHTLVRDDRGRLVGDVVLVQDLSREREAHALKEDFVARVSHELRTPLSPLRGYAQIMLRAGDRIEPGKRDEILTTMVERVGHLERLIDDLLLVSQVSSGESGAAEDVHCEPTDVAQVARLMVDWVGKDHPDRELVVHVDDVAGPVIAWADPLRVSQVLTNLIKNACKYATPSTPVDVDVFRGDGTVTVTVRDRGPGIPDDKLEAIFDRFHRLDDPQRMKTAGLGLGLYIARHLTAAMGGALTVASERGRGSMFTVTLPAATEAQAAAGASHSPRMSTARAHQPPATLLPRK